MADSNLKEMMIDDINEEANDANFVADSQEKIKWYLIDTEKSFCKVWNFMISILIIYELFVVPFVLVFPDIYNTIEIKPLNGVGLDTATEILLDSTSDDSSIQELSSDDTTADSTDPETTTDDTTDAVVNAAKSDGVEMEKTYSVTT